MKIKSKILDTLIYYELWDEVTEQDIERYKLIESKFAFQDRWHTVFDNIIEDTKTNKFYIVQSYEGSTEMQESQLYFEDYGEFTTVDEVKQVEKVITVWESVGQ